MDIAEAAAAESVTYESCEWVLIRPSMPSRNTTSVVANGCPRSTRLEYFPKSHCVDAAPSANRMMMFFGVPVEAGPPLDAQPASDSRAVVTRASQRRRPADASDAFMMGLPWFRCRNHKGCGRRSFRVIAGYNSRFFRGRHVHP